MINVIKTRVQQGYRTGTFPYSKPVLPDLFLGVLERKASACTSCGKCVESCPTKALSHMGGKIDLGKCIFCGKCQTVCPTKALTFSKEHRLGVLNREKLIHATDTKFEPDVSLHPVASKLFRKSFKIREVSAGGCNACELDFNVLHTLAWDMERFGISAVASPRHADAVLITGPVSRNMLLALKKTVVAMPKPCCIIASGACAISGGLYCDHEECHSGVDTILPVDLYIPGCPPHPAVTLDALLRLMGKKIETKE